MVITVIVRSMITKLQTEKCDSYISSSQCFKMDEWTSSFFFFLYLLEDVDEAKCDRHSVYGRLSIDVI